MKRIALAVALLVSLAAPAWAGFDEGLVVYKRGDYEVALREWVLLAEKGDAKSHYSLGRLYEWGFGVPEDEAEALNAFSRRRAQRRRPLPPC